VAAARGGQLTGVAALSQPVGACRRGCPALGVPWARVHPAGCATDRRRGHSVQVTFRNPIKFHHDKELMVAAEGMYTGQVRRLCAAASPFALLSLTPLRPYTVHLLRQEGGSVCGQRHAASLHARGGHRVQR
jgi:hypothetical protein